MEPFSHNHKFLNAHEFTKYSWVIIIIYHLPPKFNWNIERLTIEFQSFIYGTAATLIKAVTEMAKFILIRNFVPGVAYRHNETW